MPSETAAKVNKLAANAQSLLGIFDIPVFTAVIGATTQHLYKDIYHKRAARQIEVYLLGSKWSEQVTAEILSPVAAVSNLISTSQAVNN